MASDKVEYDEYTGIEAQNDPEFAMECLTFEEFFELKDKLNIYKNE